MLGVFPSLPARRSVDVGGPLSGWSVNLGRGAPVAGGTDERRHHLEDVVGEVAEAER